MKLFRRLLLSLFPEEMTVNAQHPVSMFLSLISPKQLFNIIHRRVAENFKLNLYDIALDPFEVKIWFGDQPTLQVKDIDAYYAYGVVGQLNGWNYYAPGNLAVPASIVLARQAKHVWQKYDRSYGYTCIMAAYLLTFLFVGRIRIFPEWTQQERYQWFVDLFFEFYLLVARQQGTVIDDEIFAQLKKDLLLEVQIFFFLFYFYQKVNALFARSFLAPKEFYSWLFADELKNIDYKQTIETFVANWEKITVETHFGGGDVNIGKLLFPTDIQLRYLLQGDEGHTVVDHLLPPIYDDTRMDEFLRSFLKNGDQLDDFLVWLLDRKSYQQNYFQGMKQVSYHEFRLGANFEEEQERDAFISSLESGKKPGEVEIPESLKREGIVMDRLMNFYMSFIGGFWTGRGDSFGLRLFKRNLINALLVECQEDNLKQEALQRYGGLLYTYSKNLFYYSYAYEHIRAGKETFRLPYKSSYKEVYSHMYLLKLFDEHFLYTVFQDIGTSSVVITVSQSQVVKNFKHLFQERLRLCIDADAAWLLQYMYGPMGTLLHKAEERQAHLVEHTGAEDIVRLKERVYTVDLHIWVHACELLTDYPKFIDAYGKTGIIGISALLRETLFWFLLYLTYVQMRERDDATSYKSQACKQIYVSDVIQVSGSWTNEFLELIDTLAVTYHPLLELWIQLDDNMSYFALGLENWIQYITNKTTDQAVIDVSGDDVVRCRGFYKTITYYNRRIVRPK
jgi:hypothetical protein